MHYFILSRIDKEIEAFFCKYGTSINPVCILFSKDLLDMLVADYDNMMHFDDRPVSYVRTKDDFLKLGLPVTYKGFPILIVDNMIDYVRVVG